MADCISPMQGTIHIFSAWIIAAKSTIYCELLTIFDGDLISIGIDEVFSTGSMSGLAKRSFGLWSSSLLKTQRWKITLQISFPSRMGNSPA